MYTSALWRQPREF